MSKTPTERTQLNYTMPGYVKRALMRIATKKGISINEVLTTTMESVYRREFTEEKQRDTRRVIMP